MQSLYEEICELDQDIWDYYQKGNPDALRNPFNDGNAEFNYFIRAYFRHGGKAKALEIKGIDINNLRFPDHICSVFFLGLLLYKKTSLHLKYEMGRSKIGYEYFPLTWFLISLFHDQAYQIEQDSDKRPEEQLQLKNLISEHNVEHLLFEQEFTEGRKDLLDSRKKYFSYRTFGRKIDHGLFGGLILFDKLVKIRRDRVHDNTDKSLDWNEQLELIYQKAADAVSVHNIWTPQSDGDKEIYNKFKLDELVMFKAVLFEEHPLLYILGIVDTLEPLKAYNCVHDYKYVLENLLVQWKPNGFLMALKDDSLLNFESILGKGKYFDKWLDVKFTPSKDRRSFEIEFR